MFLKKHGIIVGMQPFSVTPVKVPISITAKMQQTKNNADSLMHLLTCVHFTWKLILTNHPVTNGYNWLPVFYLVDTSHNIRKNISLSMYAQPKLISVAKFTFYHIELFTFIFKDNQHLCSFQTFLLIPLSFVYLSI